VAVVLLLQLRPGFSAVAEKKGIILKVFSVTGCNEKDFSLIDRFNNGGPAVISW
jgi:hypothetical protein